MHDNPEVDRLPVIRADLCSIEDKQAVLHRKRYLRAMPMYHTVFIKSSKTHTDQVMDANFSVMLNEISNGESYFISDNGRIRRRHRTSRTDDQHNDQTYRYTGYSNGGALPKTNTYHDESNATVNNLYNEQRQTIDHTTLTTAYDTYTQHYIDRFSNPQHNQHHNDVGRTVTQACSKN